MVACSSGSAKHTLPADISSIFAAGDEGEGMLRRGLAQDICNLSCSVIYPRYLIAQVIIALKEQILHAWNKK